MCNLIIFAIPQNLWTPYHNFRVLRWYNYEHYKRVYRRIFATYTGPWTCYEYYTNTSTFITRLTPDIIQDLKLSKTFQQITRYKISSIPYFKKNMPDYDEEHHI